MLHVFSKYIYWFFMLLLCSLRVFFFWFSFMPFEHWTTEPFIVMKLTPKMFVLKQAIEWNKRSIPFSEKPRKSTQFCHNAFFKFLPFSQFAHFSFVFFPSTFLTSIKPNKVSTLAKTIFDILKFLYMPFILCNAARRNQKKQQHWQRKKENVYIAATEKYLER